MVKIVIPVYTTDLNAYEWYALEQCFCILRNYPVVFVKPYSLDISLFNERFGSKFTFESFPDHYFANIKSYNQLMLSSEFYQRFLDVKYILIYQTDALVFRDELEEWCVKGYDYIGAPWIPKMKYVKGGMRIVWFIRLLLSYLSFSSSGSLRNNYKVGNGGFSLRNTQAFYNLTNEMATVISHYKENGDRTDFNEDIFWGIEANKDKKRLKIPSYKEALGFSMEMFPDASFFLNKKQLPFGTHAWFKAPYDEFWKQFVDFGQFKN